MNIWIWRCASVLLIFALDYFGLEGALRYPRRYIRMAIGLEEILSEEYKSGNN